MKMNSYRCLHFVALAFVLVTTAPFISADEPSPKPVTGQASAPQVSQDIPKIQESVTHFVLFSGPKDVIKDWMINTTLMRPVKIDDPAITIEPDVRQFAPNIPDGIPVGVDTSPIKVSIGGSFPAENRGLIYQIILKSYKPVSKAELEELFAKYLRAVDQKLMVYSNALENDLTQKKAALNRRIQQEKVTIEEQQRRLFEHEQRVGTSMSIAEAGKYELELQRDLTKSDLEVRLVELRINSLRKAVDAEDRLGAEEIASLNSKHEDLLAARKALMQKLGADHPDVKAIDEKIDLYSQRRKTEINKDSNASARTSLLNELRDALNDREIALLKRDATRIEQSKLEATRQLLNNIERMKFYIGIEIRRAEEQITKQQREYIELDDISYHIIRERLANNEMAMITILDPAPKPEAKAEDKAPSNKAKDEKQPTSPAPAESPK